MIVIHHRNVIDYKQDETTPHDDDHHGGDIPGRIPCR